MSYVNQESECQEFYTKDIITYIMMHDKIVTKIVTKMAHARYKLLQFTPSPGTKDGLYCCPATRTTVVTSTGYLDDIGLSTGPANLNNLLSMKNIYTYHES